MDPSQQSRPLLHTSCLLGDQENVLRLISAGVDVNELDFAGCTAIQLASAAGYLNIVKILLQNGAKPELQDSSHGNTCLHESSWRGFSCLVKLLCSPTTIDIQNYGGFSPLHLSCQAGHNQSTRELLLSGANPNLVNTYGDTPLHTSVRYGHAGVCRILLSARADNDIQNKNGDTALHISAAMHRKKLTKILLSSGCNPNIQNNQNETPLNICERKGFQDVMHVIQNPPNILTPMQRDEMRASKFKINSQPATALQQASSSSSSGQQGQINSNTTLRQQISSLLFSNKNGNRKSLANQSQQLSPCSEQPEKATGAAATTVVCGKDSSCKLYKARCGSSQSCPYHNNSGSKGSKHNSASNLNEKSVAIAGCSKDIAKVKVVSVNVNGNTEKNDIVKEEAVVGWSPYGCHYHPNPSAFPKPNIDSLPKEPLTTGELYYLDLAGNIHKGPRGISDCYCNTLLSQNQSNSQSMVALNDNNNGSKVNKKSSKHHNTHTHSSHHHGEGYHSQRHQRGGGGERVQGRRGLKQQDLDRHQELTTEPPIHIIGKGTKYEEQLKTLTTQLSKIHLDTQAQLSSLHSILNEKFKDKRSHSRQNGGVDDEVCSEEGENPEEEQQGGAGCEIEGETDEFNANKLKEWVKKYRRFRKEISKNPKMLNQANELLASASNLLSTRLPSPQPPDSETDSGL